MDVVYFSTCVIGEFHIGDLVPCCRFPWSRCKHTLRLSGVNVALIKSFGVLDHPKKISSTITVDSRRNFLWTIEHATKHAYNFDDSVSSRLGPAQTSTIYKLRRTEKRLAGTDNHLTLPHPPTNPVEQKKNWQGQTTISRSSSDARIRELPPKVSGCACIGTRETYSMDLRSPMWNSLIRHIEE